MPSCKFPRLILTTALAALIVPLVHALDIPPREKAPNDESEYRRFTLDNGMKVMLLSDPKLNKSSASVCVGVGSLSDPHDRQGLAHFLEHMLFLGTEKYPEASEFGNYLKSNGGYNNAYTAGDRTNFHFEIRHEAMAGALDRFSQFFIAPLFTPEFTEREMNAVNSENQKNLENDNWRGYQLSNTLYRKGHPANHFSTGSRETLAGTTHEELLAFYNAHYSANLMTLAITGKASLDQLESWAREYFSPVKNKDLPPIRYPSDYLVPKAALRLARMEPLKDLRELNLEFPLPGTTDLWPGKSVRMVGLIFGYEGEGSLLSYLKSEGLATTLGAGVNDETHDYSSFNVSIGLTPAGLEHYERVLQLFFTTVANLKSAGYPEHLFKERKALARLDETYVDKGEGTQLAVGLANNLQDYPMDVAEREPYLWVKPDPASYDMVLDHLRSDNMLVILEAKGVETDKVEPVYGTKYSYVEETGPAYTALSSPPKVAEIYPPKPNPFVPDKASVLAMEPVRLIDEKGLSLYYLQDTEFERPMVAQVYRFRLPRSMGTLQNAVLLGFYQACVNEALNEIAYTASVAGLHLNLAADLEGVNISIDGYDESADKLVDAVAANLVDFKLSEERFAGIKDRFVRGLRNFPRSDAWQILLQTRRSVVREFYYRPDEQLPVAEKVTLDQVKAFAHQLYKAGKLEALVHGNVTEDRAIASARRLAKTFAMKPIADDQILRRRLLVEKPGEALIGSEQLIVNNSAYRQEYLLGGDAPEIRATTHVLANFIGDPFYSELRTHQQLGYIVFGGAGDEERSNFAYFIIQSGDHPADRVMHQAEAFISGLPQMLQGLPDEAWKMIVAGTRAQLEEKDKTIAERAGRLFALAYDYDAEWNRRKDTLAALDSLTRPQVVDILSKALDPKTQEKRTFLGFARDHEPEKPIENDFADLTKWKQKRSYR